MVSDPAAALADKFRRYALFKLLCEQFSEPVAVAVELVQQDIKNEREAQILLGKRWLERPPAPEEKVH